MAARATALRAAAVSASFSLVRHATSLPGRALGGLGGHFGVPPTYRHSSALKKYGISNAAVSGASEPCTALASIELANSLRMVPAAALAGSVAPMRSRHFLMALSASSTIGMHGPCVMKAQRLWKNGRWR